MKKDLPDPTDLTLLYELSLEIGPSCHLDDLCGSFVSLLMSRKGLSHVSIWIKSGRKLQPVYEKPGKLKQYQSISCDHAIWENVRTQAMWMVEAGDPLFQSCAADKDIDRGIFAIFRLGHIGFLQLHHPEIDGFSPGFLRSFNDIAYKFSLALDTCLTQLRRNTEREEELSDKKALFENDECSRFVVQNLSEGIILTDLDGRIIYANKRMEQLTGYSYRELLGQLSYKLLLSQKEEKSLRDNLKERKEGISQDYVAEHIHKSGAKWMGRIKATPYRNAQGIIVGTMGAVTNISAQKLAEIKLKDSEKMLRKIINTSLDAVINIDETGIIEEWSEQAITIFGFTRQEALHQNILDLVIPAHHRKKFLAGIKNFRALHDGSAFKKRVEITAINKDQKEFPVEISVSPIQLGNKFFFSGFVRDITERRKAQRELVSAKQAAEQAQLAEQQFLANMSHEIRTPMNAVIGMTHLLYETQPTALQKEYLDSLRFSADSLMGIISNILDLSKIEANAIKFEQHPFNLLQLLTSLQQTFQLKVRDKPISVVCDMDPAITHLIIGDSLRLNQILTNLLGNASKFTHQGTIGVKAQLVSKRDDHYMIEFQVHDSGIGINTRHIDKIFENFKQADVQITRKFGGTGLGLTIVKQLVELQGGQISVKSEKGVGSVFTVIIPFVDSGIRQEEKPLSHQVIDISDSIKNTYFLVAEDNPMNQKLIKKIFGLWGCQFEIASDGLVAVAKSKEKKYDIILMDIHMPEMDGCEATVEIRRDKNNPNFETPIIALTAAALLDEKNRALDAGMNDFLTKPFTPSKLREQVGPWLNLEPVRLKSLDSTIHFKEEIISIDFSYLMEMSQGDEEFIQDMIETFLMEIPKALKLITQALDQKNWSTISRIAHRVKTNYLMVGLNIQRENAQAIEKMTKLKDFDVDEVVTRIHQLKNDSKLAYPLLEEALKNIGEEKVITYNKSIINA